MQWKLAVTVTVALMLAAAAVGAEVEGEGERTTYGATGNLQAMLLALRTELVQREINLTPEQAHRLSPLRDELEKLIRADTDTDLFSPDFPIRKQVREILRPAQLRRLEEIMFQYFGPTLFVDPEISRMLALSDEQKQAIEKLMEDRQRRLEALFRELELHDPTIPMSQEENRKRSRESLKREQVIENETVDRIVRTLSPEQGTVWNTLLGKKIDVGRLSEQMHDSRWEGFRVMP